MIDFETRMLGMQWIVQENIRNEPQFDNFVKALREAKQHVSLVKIVPFSHQIIPEPERVCEKIVVWGSTTLDYIAKERRWKPGTYHNDRFDQQIWTEAYGDLCLNKNGLFCKFGEVPEYSGFRFIRPVEDRKVFAGTILCYRDLHKWKKQVDSIQDGYATLTPDTIVGVFPVADIITESRHFVVAGEVVTSTFYRINGRLSPKRMEPQYDALRKVLEKWQPSEAFVVDMALVKTPTGAETKVIEINTINSSGFYDADVERIVFAIIDMEKRRWFF